MFSDQKSIGRSPLFYAVCIGAGLVMMGYFIGAGLQKFRTKRIHTVRVKGLSEREVKSDFAVWRLGFKSTEPTLKEATKTFTKSRKHVQAFLREKGFKGADISEQSPRTSKDHHRIRDETVIEYTTRGAFVVRTTDVDRVEKYAADLAQLVEKDVMLDHSQPRYLLKDFDALRPVMLEESTKSARSMAKKFADHAQAKVGPILSADQGHFSIRNGEGGYDAETTLMKKVRVVSHLDYELLEG